MRRGAGGEGSGGGDGRDAYGMLANAAGACASAHRHGCHGSSSSGYWTVSPATTPTGNFDPFVHKECLRRCIGCERCHFISVSSLTRDCSWFSSCPALTNGTAAPARPCTRGKSRCAAAAFVAPNFRSWQVRHENGSVIRAVRAKLDHSDNREADGEPPTTYVYSARVFKEPMPRGWGYTGHQLKDIATSLVLAELFNWTAARPTGVRLDVPFKGHEGTLAALPARCVSDEYYPGNSCYASAATVMLDTAFWDGFSEFSTLRERVHNALGPRMERSSAERPVHSRCVCQTNGFRVYFHQLFAFERAGFAPLAESQRSVVAVRRAERSASALCLCPSLVLLREARQCAGLRWGVHARGEGKPPLYACSSRINVHGAMEHTQFKSSRLPPARVLTVPQRTEICRLNASRSRQAPLRAPRHRMTPPTPPTQRMPGEAPRFLRINKLRRMRAGAGAGVRLRREASVVMARRPSSRQSKINNKLTAASSPAPPRHPLNGRASGPRGTSPPGASPCARFFPSGP